MLPTLALAQFLMTLDISVMNVSIATVAKDVGTRPHASTDSAPRCPCSPSLPWSRCSPAAASQLSSLRPL